MNFYFVILASLFFTLTEIGAQEEECHQESQVTIGTTNDLAFPPLGVIPYLIDPYQTDLLNPEFDKGYTAGLYITLQLSNRKSHWSQINFKLSSDLYTGPEGTPPEVIGPPLIKNGVTYPTLLHHIFFTERNQLRSEIRREVFQEMQKTDQRYFLHVNVSVIYDNRGEQGFPGVRSMQELFHTAADHPGQAQFEYYNQESSFHGQVGSSLSLQKELSLNFTLEIESGVSISSLKTLNNIFLHPKFNLQIPTFKRKGRFYANLDQQMVLHLGGAYCESGLRLGLGYKKLELENSVNLRFGEFPTPGQQEFKISRPYYAGFALRYFLSK